MANIKSQKKRILTNEKARMRNRAVRSELKTATRTVHDAVEAKNGADAYACALTACRLMDKAVSKGVIHKRQAANHKSGLMKLANTVATDADRAAYEVAEKKAQEKKGSKKAAAKAEREANMKKASEEKAKRRTETQKSQKSAAKKKAAEEEAAAKAEAEAAAAEPAEAPAEAAAE
ncbi:MAG: 30S ribosomal protein S20 [Raoultibacter sp.]